MPAMLTLAATNAPKLKRLTVDIEGQALPSVIHGMTQLSNLKELELRDRDLPDKHNTLAISNLSGLRSLRVSPLNPYHEFILVHYHGISFDCTAGTDNLKSNKLQSETLGRMQVFTIAWLCALKQQEQLCNIHGNMGM